MVDAMRPLQRDAETESRRDNVARSLLVAAPSLPATSSLNLMARTSTTFHLPSKVDLFSTRIFRGPILHQLQTPYVNRKPRTPDYEKKINVSDSWVQR